MAKTGLAYVKISPGRIQAGIPETHPVAEKSAQTALQGSPGLITGGYFLEYTAGGGTIYGFFADAGQGGASDGAKTARVYRAAGGTRFVGTLKGVLAQTHIGSAVALIKDTTWYLDPASSVSSDAECVVLGPAQGFRVGDTNALVEFAVLESKIGDF